MKRLHIASIGLAAAMALAALNVASTTYGQAPSAESTADSWVLACLRQPSPLW